MKPFLVALRFLTRIPVAWNAPNARQLGQSLLYYPAVGVLLGIALAALCRWLGAGPLSAALVVAAWALLTGLLHLDGLADTADAWIGGLGDRARTLEIMKDPRCGPAGVAAILLVLLVKFAAVLELAGNGSAWLALLLAPLLGRVAPPLLFATLPYVRPGGLGEALAANLPRRAALMLSILVAVAIALGAGHPGRWALIAAAATFVAMRAWLWQRLGGTTGDTAGALIELVETAVLVGVAFGTA